MSKPFDATLKDLIRAYPADWLAQVGERVTAPPEVLSVELSTVTAAADALIRVGRRVVHIDVESGPDDSLAERMLLYNVLAHRHTGLPVRSVVVLLRSNAARAGFTGRVAYEGLSFRLDVVRVWEVPADALLEAGVGLMPLAVLGKPPPGTTRETALPAQVARIAARARAEAGPRAGEVMTSAFILAGMHTGPDLLEAIFKGAGAMYESSAFQVVEKWAKERYAREVLLQMGTAKFGEPTEEQAARLEKIDSLPRLTRMMVKFTNIDSWDALLRVR
jgi:hypothetical protein